MQLSCDDIEYGFATVPSDFQYDTGEVLGSFQESEGLTIFAKKEYFETKNLDFEGTFAKLTIEVHTSLELVGLTATLASKLTASGISANVVAAYYHDHIFVQYGLRNKAINSLNELKGQ